MIKCKDCCHVLGWIKNFGLLRLTEEIRRTRISRNRRVVVEKNRNSRFFRTFREHRDVDGIKFGSTGLKRRLTTGTKLRAGGRYERGTSSVSLENLCD